MRVLAPFLLASAIGLAPSVVVAQEPARQDETKVAAAIDAWLTSDQTSEELQKKTVTAVLAPKAGGIAQLGGRLTAAPKDKGLCALTTHVALEFVRREAEGKVVFAGQYAPLSPLLPYAVDLFFELLLDTPPWFPDTHRIRLVPALRDLQPSAPDEARLDRVAKIVEDERVEPKDLRTALACMLWQWGHKRYVQPEIDRLVRESADGKPEDRLAQMQELADLWYRLREYRNAASTHRALQALATHAGIPLKPLDWYWAACVESLSGDVERGITALTRCAELQASPDTDASHKVDPAVFELDPEIRALRSDPRFAAIVAKALGKEAPTGRRD